MSKLIIIAVFLTLLVYVSMFLWKESNNKDKETLGRIFAAFLLAFAWACAILASVVVLF